MSTADVKESPLFCCCSACWHSPERPCPDVVSCVTTGKTRCHSGAACEEKRTAWASALQHRNAAEPIVYIGMGTCGLGAGAGKSLAALKAYLAKTGRRATIVEVGCLGLCSREPLIDLQL